jgi:glycosyltransferase involved in cell wall biosynthesis
MLKSQTQPHKPLIAAIIPAYNEELNIAAVLQVLHETDILDEIILVDDASRDRTPEIMNQAAAQDKRMQVIHLETNQGKGQAVFNGWVATTAPYLLLLDADLKNLTPGHLRALLVPVLDHRADMTLGLFWGGHFNTDLSHWLTPFLTGQRGLRSDLMENVSREAAAGYGFDVALTIAANQAGYRTRRVLLKGVWHPSSEIRPERGGYWPGRIWKLRMYGQIIRSWFIATRQRYPKTKTFFSTLLKP